MSTSLVLALVMVLGADAGAAEGPEETLGAPASTDPEADLRAAREVYVLGGHAEARERFVAIVQRARVRGDVPKVVVARALVYLGEIQMLSGDRRGADASFRLALAEQPELRLSPVEHPDNVIGAFEVVRTAVLAEGERAPATRPPLPWWGYAPFGVPQFREGKPVRGVVYATLQVGFAAASVAAWFVVDDAVARIPIDPPNAQEEAAYAARQQAVLIRDTASYGTAAAFYVTWAASVVDAGIAWRRGRVLPTGIAVLPTRDGVGARATFTF